MKSQGKRLQKKETTCAGPQREVSLVCWRNRKTVRVVKEYGVRDRVKEREGCRHRQAADFGGACRIQQGSQYFIIEESLA